VPAGDIAPVMREDQEVQQLLRWARRQPQAYRPGGAEREERSACRRPQRHTRQRIHGLALEDLSRLARELGLRRLGCPEDRHMAGRALPLPEGLAEGGPLQVPGLHFLERLTWSELVNILQDTARQRLRDLRDLGDESLEGRRELQAWEYFESVCESLFQARLRGSGASSMPELGPSSWSGGPCSKSLASWRVGRLCAENGLLVCWEEVLRRLGRGATLFLTALPVPLLSEELQMVSQLVPCCTVMSAVVHSSASLEVPLLGCDVLYVAGEHGRGLPGLRFAHIPRMILAVLNMCRSEALARRLLSSGVQHVVCWPADVHDQEATEFGLAFVHCLFEHDIAEAFAKAVSGVCLAERAPRLLVQPCQIPPAMGAGTAGVVLACHGQGASGPVKYAGQTAQVFFHTAANGWVRVSVSGNVISWRMGHWHLSGGQGEGHDDSALTGAQVQSKSEAKKCFMRPVPSVILIREDRPRLRRGLARESLDEIIQAVCEQASGVRAPAQPALAAHVCTEFSGPARLTLRGALHLEAMEEGGLHSGKGVVLIAEQPKPHRKKWRRGLVRVQPKPRRPRWIKGLGREAL